MTRRRNIWAAALLCGLAAGPAAFPAAGGASGEPAARAHRLADALLAPCCYADTVSRHQSEAAVKMRAEIARWIADGRTDQEILDTYVSRYGRKILAGPRAAPGWWAPWVPWLAMALGAALLGGWLLRRWRARPLAEAPAPAAPLPDLEDEE